MDKLLKQRGWVKGTITRASANARGFDSSTPMEQLKNRLHKLEEAYSEFVDISKALYDYAGGENFVDPAIDAEEYEEKYFLAHATLSRLINEQMNAQPVKETESDDSIEKLLTQQAKLLDNFSATVTHSNVHFPKISLPNFSGNYSDWPSFRDLFRSAIDNKSNLSNIQKFHYLKSYLQDEALSLVKHIPLTDNNYKDAWDRLVERYDKKPLIVHSLVQQFLSLSPCSSPNITVLRNLADKADETVRGLDALNCNSRDPWLVAILLGKVDEETKKEWAKNGDSHTVRSFDELVKFLSHRCDALESCNPSRSVHKKRTALAHYAQSGESSANCCIVCAEQHTVSQCPKFKQMDSGTRRAYVKDKQLCFNCLRSSHNASHCPSNFRCKLCRSKHHTLVHMDKELLKNTQQWQQQSNTRPTGNTATTAAVTTDHNSRTSVVSAHASNKNTSTKCVPTTLLPTILANVVDSYGNLVNCRILLDTGSTVSFVTECFTQRIGLSRKNARISVLGLSACAAGTTRGCVQLKLLSRLSDQCFEISAYVLPKLTTDIPTNRVDCSSSEWEQILNLQLADPTFSDKGSVDVIIGADQLWTIFTGERQQFDQTMPIALNSIFGWVIAGKCSVTQLCSPPAITNHAIVDLDSLVRSFMEMDSLPTTTTVIPVDAAEKHFSATHTRSQNGTYIVEYPFKEDAPPIHRTLQPARTRLLTMEKRFRTCPELKQQYTDFMNEYLALGHMEKLSSEAEGYDRCFYLPHHAVLKPESTTTQCRVVFDGSSKDSSGVSLNQRLHVGPPIQRDLLTVSLRFRQHRFVFCADIQKMFRGIRVSDKHTNFQRIVWRTDENSPIEHYRLLTVTYGLTSSPFIAVRVLKQLADDHRVEFPTASRVLQNDAYVDDILTGCSSAQDLIELKDELISLLSKANFSLRKWSSNCWPLLNTLPKEICEYNPVDLTSQSVDAFVKILGVQWNPCTDELSIKIKSMCVNQPTKRLVLSEMSKIYDPLGIVSPSVVLFKVLFQELWLLGVHWDDKLPMEVSTRWQQYVQELELLNQISIPRLIASDVGLIEIHGFADASSVAYAAVVYSRTNVNGEFRTNIIASKTRVAPLKPISIPRLELNAALLLTKLIKLIQDSLTVTIENLYCYTDSQIVLHWLSSHPRRWTTYVCNRTAEILERFPRSYWHHVSTEQNPADCASRGLTPAKLIAHKLWWNGPHWLSLPKSEWPIAKHSNLSHDDASVLAEQKPIKQQSLFVSTKDDVIENLLKKVSSWSRLIRIFAYCLRLIFVRNNEASVWLSSTELQRASNIIIRHVQQSAFLAEYQLLQHKKPLALKSSLIRYTPFLDKDGLLRVGGRIKHANINYNTKYPLLLPKCSSVSLLLVRYIHETYLHTGVEATVTLLRQRYWILGVRNLVRKVIFSCKRCFVQRRTTTTQIMANLPPPRVQPSRCFLHCGLDYAGPIPIKMSRGRNPKIGKAWFSIFVCFSTKALHIELVSDLTADAFLAAFRRFIARRGKPTDLYSDNGTTFHGAKRKMNELQQLILSQGYLKEVAESLANDGVHWHFNPPSAPHFGGLWEANVRSIKLHLRRVIGHSTLTFEEYTTVLAQIESILNSRPLCAISDDDLDPLTPAHFLIGEPYTCVPEPSLLNISPNRLDHWRHLQAMVQGFWKRWHTEYLTSLQQRQKWQKVTPNLEEGTLVVLKEPNLPPSKWVLGRIIDVNKGDDERVRVVTVKTSRGEYKRPITKIAPLPCS